jgi:Ser/Thr protein kinase RdoA (MazF antagonist)
LKPAFTAARFFLSKQDIARIEPFGTGNINDTFLVTLHQGKQLVLQRVNPAVFPEPLLVQHNMRIVTNHLEHEIRNSPARKDRFTPLVLYHGKNGDSYQAEDGSIWRLLHLVPGKTYETINTPFQAEELGRCLGIFHHLLSTIEPTKLADTLPGFHHTQACLDQYDRVRAEHEHDQDPAMKFCHLFIEMRRALATLLDDAPPLSRSVIHGDPKVANFLFDDDSDRVVSVIDLDTVRNGLLLHDIGDALRSCCNAIGESPPAPEHVFFDPDLFTAWLKGYFGEAELLLTNVDKAHIVQAVQVISFELGLRFVTDHLQGNRYFKTRFPGHNLIRAQVQFYLVQSIEDQLEELQSIVDTRIDR